MKKETERRGVAPFEGSSGDGEEMRGLTLSLP